MKLQLAIAVNGDLHIWRGHSMPPATNIVAVDLDRDGDMLVIPADRAGPLSELLGTGEVAGQAVMRTDGRLERILQMAEALVDEIRAEVDGDIDDEQPGPGGP